MLVWHTLSHNLTFRSMWHFVAWVKSFVIIETLLCELTYCVCMSYYVFFPSCCGATACSGPWLPSYFSSNLLSFLLLPFSQLPCLSLHTFSFWRLLLGFWNHWFHLWGEVSLTPNTQPGRQGYLSLSSISLKTWPACAAHRVARLLMTLLLSLLVHASSLIQRNKPLTHCVAWCNILNVSC